MQPWHKYSLNHRIFELVSLEQRSLGQGEEPAVDAARAIG